MVALTVPVGEAKKGETAPRRRAQQKDGTVFRPLDSSATTLPEFIEESVKRHGSRKAMGWRNLIDIHTETKTITKFVKGEETQVEKDWVYYENGPYQFITYPELLTLTKAYGRGLVELGLKPSQDKLHIYALTSHKWLQTYIASQFQSLPIVTAYDTLGESGLTHSLVQTESNAIFTDNVLLGSLVRPLQKAKSIRYIIHSEPISELDKRNQGKFYLEAVKAIKQIKEVRPDIEFISYDEVIAKGKESTIAEHLPKPEDLLCIMYTSGSTGDPKGVVITHENIVAAVGGASTVTGRDLVKNTDRTIAFLPLAHIFELVFELVSIWWGACLGYANVKTLTDTSCKNCASDLAEFKPTIMVGVAAVWESVRKGVLAKLHKLPGWKQKVFWTAFKAKQALNNYKLPGGGVFDIVFKEIKSATGGHLRVVLNGGSPISTDAQNFISVLIAPMLIGYGLTETCANATIVDHRHIELGVCGTILGSVTAKLVDVSDAGYFAKNNQGEILLKGGPVTNEYFKNEKETAEAFTPDGWFRTGDIGEWTASGALRIIDRKKNLVKTLNGEYIALEKLESTYRSNPVVLNLLAYADQNQVKPILIVLPNEPHLKQFIIKEGIYSEKQVDSKDLSFLCEDDKVRSAVLKSILATGKLQGLKGIELVQSVILADDEWTPQNGLVTSAQKLQRKKILAKYEDKVQEAYS